MKKVLGNMLPALSDRNYRLFILGFAASWTGYAVQGIAMGWLGWTLTESPLWLGAIGFADLIPPLLLGPFAGAVADRVDRFRMLRITQCLSLVQAGLLALAVFSDFVSPSLLIVFAVVHGSIIAFSEPAFYGLVPRLISHELMPSAISLNALAGNVGMLSGPALAAFLILVGGPELAFTFNATAYLLYVWILSSIRLAPAQVNESSGKTIYADVIDGVKYALGHPGISRMFVLTVVHAFVARSMTHMMPGMVAGVFQRNVSALATVEASGVCGSFLANTWLARRGKRKGLVLIVLLSTLLCLSATVVFVFVEMFALAVLAWFVHGAFLALRIAGTDVLLQSSVNDSMRSRVMGGWHLLSRSSGAIGALGMGWLIELFGFKWPFAAASMLTAAYVIWLLFQRRKVVDALEL